MTRRYPWAWYTALRDANCNAVRLHAQPFPSFYLDVADEMGILVLDESAMWASDEKTGEISVVAGLNADGTPKRLYSVGNQQLFAAGQ